MSPQVPVAEVLAERCEVYDVRRVSHAFGPWINYRQGRHGDVREFWERYRLQWLVREVDRGPNPAGAVVDALSTFLEREPPLQGLSWTSALEGAVRAVALALVSAVLWRRGTWTREVAGLIGETIQGCEDLIELAFSPGSSRNNHAMGERAASALVRMIRGASQETVRRGVLDAADEFLVQTYPDGSGKEAASGYWRFNYEWAMLVLAMAAAAEVSLPQSFVDRLALSETLLGELGTGASTAFVLGDADDSTVWSRYWPVETFPPNTRPSERGAWTGSRDLQVGLSIIRTVSKPALTLSFRSGPFGFPQTAAHSHADQLSIFLAVEEIPVIIDPGSDRYFGVSVRDSLRLEESHATFTVVGQRQAVPTGRFLWTNQVSGQLVQAACAGVRCVRGGLNLGLHRLERTVLWDDSAPRVQIVDAVEGPPSQAIWTWPFAPTVGVVPVGPSEWSISAGEHVLRLSVEGLGKSVESTIGDGYVSPSYGATRRGLVMRIVTRAPVQLHWEFSVKAPSGRT